MSILLMVGSAAMTQTGGGATLVGTVTDSTGAAVAGAGHPTWMQAFATKSWNVGERLKLSARLDGHNLPWKRSNLAAPNTSYKLNNIGAWGRFTGVVGDFSNCGTGQANVQMSIRAEF